MTDLMKMVAKVRLFKVAGFAQGDRGVTHLEEGQLFAAVDEEDAIAKAEEFWVQHMGFTQFTGVATLIDRVDGYKIVLVEEEILTNAGELVGISPGAH